MVSISYSLLSSVKPSTKVYQVTDPICKLFWTSDSHRHCSFFSKAKPEKIRSWGRYDTRDTVKRWRGARFQMVTSLTWQLSVKDSFSGKNGLSFDATMWKNWILPMTHAHWGVREFLIPSSPSPPYPTTNNHQVWDWLRDRQTILKPKYTSFEMTCA